MRLRRRPDRSLEITKADAHRTGLRTVLDRSPSPTVVAVIALGCLSFAALSVWLALESDHLSQPALRAALGNWIAIPYIAAGLVAWWRRPGSRFGWLMIAAGFGTYMSLLTWSNGALFYTIGHLFDFLPPVLFLHLILAFPTGRLDGGLAKGLVVLAYLIGIGLQVVRMMLGGVQPPTLLQIVSNPEAALFVEHVLLIGISALSLTGIGVLAIGRKARGRPLRRSIALLVDFFAVGLLMIALLFLAAVFEWSVFESIRRATFFVLGLAPVAFLIGLLHARLARSAVGDLIVSLREDPAPERLGPALAVALRDPSLTLAYWLPEYERYSDLDGQPIEPLEEVGRAVTPIDRDGAHVALLLHDPALRDEPELLAAVAAAAAIALENARLQAELRARVEELRGSRARILEAGQQERARLERNLHDGAQQRLIALSLDLSQLESSTDLDSEARSRIDRAKGEIAASLEELREIARGLHPAVVSGHGLAVALESLAARAPIPVSLTVETGGRLPDPVEVAAYYVVSESLANVAKHSNATGVTIDVTRIDGEAVIEVMDDGIGGADTETGTGLRGLADRVEALDGRLFMWSPSGGGTRLRAEIPCE